MNLFRVKALQVLFIVLLGGMLLGFLNLQLSNDYVVFDAEYTNTFFQDRGAFTPTDAEVVQAEKIFLEAEPALSNHCRQYYGVLNGKGEKEIILTSFRKGRVKEFPQWKKEIVIVDDGGDDFYDGAVNLNTKTLLHLTPHGEA